MEEVSHQGIKHRLEDGGKRMEPGELFQCRRAPRLSYRWSHSSQESDDRISKGIFFLSRLYVQCGALHGA